MNFVFKTDKFWGAQSFNTKAVFAKVKIIATGTSAIYIENIYIQNFVTETLKPSRATLFPVAMLNTDFRGVDFNNLTPIHPGDKEYHIPYLDNYLIQPGNKYYLTQGIAANVFNYRTRYKAVLYPDDFMLFDVAYAPNYQTAETSEAKLVIKYKLGPNERMLEINYNIVAGSILNDSSVYGEGLSDKILYINGLPVGSIIDLQ